MLKFANQDDVILADAYKSVFKIFNYQNLFIEYTHSKNKNAKINDSLMYPFPYPCTKLLGTKRPRLKTFVNVPQIIFFKQNALKIYSLYRHYSKNIRRWLIFIKSAKHWTHFRRKFMKLGRTVLARLTVWPTEWKNANKR